MAKTTGLFRWFWSWWMLGNDRPDRSDWTVVMYTRSGCHLCDEAWTQLQSTQPQYGYQLDSIDIDTDPDLTQNYGECVPVVAINGKVRFRGRINPVLWQRHLDHSPR